MSAWIQAVIPILQAHQVLGGATRYDWILEVTLRVWLQVRVRKLLVGGNTKSLPCEGLLGNSRSLLKTPLGLLAFGGVSLSREIGY